MHFQIIIELAVRYFICILNKIYNWKESIHMKVLVYTIL